MPISKKIIDKCKTNDRDAQKLIFETYASQVLAICVRYVKEVSIAEDIMQETFITVFLKISQFKGTGALGGWIKRIAVNTSLMHIREAKKSISSNNLEYFLKEEENYEPEIIYDITNKKGIIEQADFSSQEMMDAITLLPHGFRTVFNLYAIEGYKHKEIAKQLEISIGTSKSQLLRARKKLQQILYTKAIEKKKNK